MTSIETCMELADALTEATAKVKDARQALLEATEQKIAAKEELLDADALAIRIGDYTASGKNEKEREAWLRKVNGDLRSKLVNTEQVERAAILALELAKDERECLKYLVRIEELGGE